MKGCRPLSQEEVEKAWGAFEGRHAVRNRCIFILGVTTGFRVSELLSLRIGDVMEGEAVKLKVSVPKRHMKGHIEGRRVLIVQEAQEAILKQVKSLREQGYKNNDTFLFRSQRRENRAIGRSVAWKILQVAFSKVGIINHVGCHAMRKTYAELTLDHLCDRLAKGERVEPLYELGLALGHRDSKSTFAYLSYRTNRAEEAARQIGKLFSREVHV